MLMKTKKAYPLFGLVCAIGLTIVQNIFAQTVRQRRRTEVMHMTLPEQQKAKEDFAKRYPLVANRMELHRGMQTGVQSVKPVADVIRSHRKPSIMKDAATSTTFLGSASYIYTDNDYAYNSFCSFNTNPFAFNKLIQNDDIIAKHGVCVKDGELYCMETEFNQLEIGLVEVTQILRSYDVNTWEENFTPTIVNGVTMTAVETAQAVDGTVYGLFYNENMSGLQWGVVDYANRTRTTISDAVNTFVALGITSDGQLYGVATDGNLYKIDKETGKETVVGATGVTVLTEEGKYYNQCGEIDPADNTFYWAAIDGRGNTALYTIDLQTGAATKLYSYDAAIYGMVFPQAAATAAAPARITDLALDFRNGSLTGNVTFTAPAKTFGGNDLQGSIGYKIYANEKEVANGTAIAGEKTSVPVTFATEGMYNIVVRTNNTAGESPKAKAKVWVGYDTPLAVTGLKATVDENNKAVVTWEAPAGAVNGGYIGKLKYDVYRTVNGDSILAGKDLDATSFTEIIPKASLASYNYVVYAKNGKLTSEPASSNDCVTGEAIEPDYMELFSTETPMKLYTVIDANNDGNTWKWGMYDNTDGYIYSMFSNAHGNDDWFITPPIHLKPKYKYTLSFLGQEWLAKCPNTLEIKYGKAASLEAMTNTIQATTALTADMKEYSYTISVAEDATYFIGFHDNTEKAGQYRLRIDSIAVSANSLDIAPAAVENLTVVPDSKGKKKADVKFTLPSKTVGGAALAAVDSVEITRGNKIIATLKNKKAGENISYTDDTPNNAIYKYSVRCYYGGEFSPVVSASKFIGTDTPTIPQGVKITDNGNKINVAWNKFDRGINGGYIDPSDIAVTVFSTANYPFFGPQVKDSISTSKKGDLSIEIDQNPEETVSDDGSQSMIYYGLQAKATGSESDITITDGFIVGPSIPLPFCESMKSGNVENGIVWLESSQDREFTSEDEAPSVWTLTTSLSYDNDGGSAIWMPYTEYGVTYSIAEGDMCSFNLPKVSMVDSTKPQLLFSVYATKNDNVKLDIVAMTPDKKETVLKTLDFSTNQKEGWYRYQVDLNSVKAARYAIIKFRATSTGNNSILALDAIRIFNQYTDNLAANSLVAPKYVQAGKTAKVNVEIENIGENEAKDFSVVLYADGKAVDNVKVSDAIAVLGTRNVKLTLPVKINSGNSVKVKAEVKYNADMDAADNFTEETEVKVEQSDYPAVTDLHITGDNGAALAWSQPAKALPKTITEDFESYDGWTTNEWGHWTTIDNDDAYAGKIFSDITLPHQGEQYAFILTDVSGEYRGLQANYGNHTDGGTKYLSAFYGVNSSNTQYAATDNWLISSVLSGNRQTISFYAENHNNGSKTYPETLYVLYSTTGKEIGDFTAVGKAISVKSGSWQQYSVEIPEGARYFAIENKNAQGEGLWLGLDDITYEAGASGTDETIVTYNIYRDGELLASVNGSTLAFVDEAGDGTSHSYNVTAVYEDKNGVRTESPFSNTVSATASLDEIYNGEGVSKYDVYTIDGKTVIRNTGNVKDIPSGMYIINDKKIILK